MEEFKTKFNIEELDIKTIGNWTISLRPVQVTLGSLVLSLNRKCATFSELAEREGEELVLAFKEIELLFQKTLKPDKINYLALMMVDEQVHYHVIPRYEKSVNWNGQIFEDKDWPKPPNVLNGIDLVNLESLLVYLKDNS